MHAAARPLPPLRDFATRATYAGTRMTRATYAGALQAGLAQRR